MAVHLVGSFVACFTPMLGLLVWTLVKLSPRVSSNTAAGDFARRDPPLSLGVADATAAGKPHSL